MIIILEKSIHVRKPNKNVNNLIQESIFGIGLSYSNFLVKQLTGRHNIPVNRCKWRHFIFINKKILISKLILKDELKALRKKNLKLYKRIRCFHGIRLSLFLPSRGQRTKSNAMGARYVNSKTFEHVDTRPTMGKRISSYIKRTPLLKKLSEARYNTLLKRYYERYKKNLDDKQIHYIMKNASNMGTFKRFIPKVKLNKVKGKKKTKRN